MQKIHYAPRESITRKQGRGKGKVTIATGAMIGCFITPPNSRSTLDKLADCLLIMNVRCGGERRSTHGYKGHRVQQACRRRLSFILHLASRPSYKSIIVFPPGCYCHTLCFQDPLNCAKSAYCNKNRSFKEKNLQIWWKMFWHPQKVVFQSYPHSSISQKCLWNTSMFHVLCKLQ